MHIISETRRGVAPSSSSTSSTSSTSSSSLDSSESLLRQLYGYDVPKHVKSLYRTVRGAVGPLGGAGAGGAIYGEVTMTSFHRLLLYLQSATGLDSNSIFLDIGAGLGKPNLHASAFIKCCSVGVSAKLVVAVVFFFLRAA